MNVLQKTRLELVSEWEISSLSYEVREIRKQSINSRQALDQANLRIDRLRSIISTTLEWCDLESNVRDDDEFHDHSRALGIRQAGEYLANLMKVKE